MSIRTKLSTLNSQLSTYKFHFLIFFISILILSRFNFDPDLGWHLFYGEHFLETGKILSADISSWTMSSYDWGNSYFLYQILTAYIFKHVGFAWAVVVFGLIGATGVLILTLGKRLDVWKVVAIALAAWLATSNLGLKPHTISFLFFSTLLVLLEKKYYFKNLFLPFWFFFFAIWANFHRGFLVGIIIFLAIVAVDILGKQKAAKKSEFYVPILSVLAGFLGTFLTPFHILLWKSAVFGDLSSKDNILTIAEWLPSAVFPQINLLFALSGTILIYLFFKKTTKRNFIWLLTGAFVFAVAFVAAAFIFYWAAILIFLIARYLEFELRFSFDRLTRYLIAIISFCVISVFTLNFAAQFLESLDLEKKLAMEGYPTQAVADLKSNNLVLNSGFFNEYNWGGYLVWQKIPTFIDGRMASWGKGGESILADYMDIAGGDCNKFQKYQIKLALLKKEANTRCFSDFKKIYEDDNAQLLASPAMR